MPTYTPKIRIPEKIDRVVTSPLMLARRLWYGYTFRRVPVSGNRYARVDPSRFHEISQYTWFGKKDGECSATYKAVRLPRYGSSNRLVYMHRQILGAQKGQIVDHRDGDGLNNTSGNLRFASYCQNASNRGKIRARTSSRYIGVHFKKSSGRWVAYITFRNKRVWLGVFDSELEAAKTYDAAAKKYHGEFACLNFPENNEKGLRGLLRHGFLRLRSGQVTRIYTVYKKSTADYFGNVRDKRLIVGHKKSSLYP